MHVKSQHESEGHVWPHHHKHDRRARKSFHPANGGCIPVTIGIRAVFEVPGVCETIYGLVHKKYYKNHKYCETSYTCVFLGIEPMTFQLLVYQRSYCRDKITNVHNSTSTQNLATKTFTLSNLSLHLQV